MDQKPQSNTNRATLALMVVLALWQVYAEVRSSQRTAAIEKFLRENDAQYSQVVFHDDATKGIMQQVFRQNEANRELIKGVLQLQK